MFNMQFPYTRPANDKYTSALDLSTDCSRLCCRRRRHPRIRCAVLKLMKAASTLSIIAISLSVPCRSMYIVDVSALHLYVCN